MRPTRLVCLLWICLIALPCLAQSTGSRPPVQQRDPAISPMDENEAQQKLAREREKKANEERAAAIKSDTDRLLKLAVELKASVDKSNEHVLSVDVIKKAEEIEKLAHSVRDKMKGPN